MKGGLQLVKGQYRSRRVLTPEEAALLGKKELTKATGTGNYDLAKQICEGHLQEFERTIAEARGDHLTPLERFERKYGSVRGRKSAEHFHFLRIELPRYWTEFQCAARP